MAWLNGLKTWIRKRAQEDTALAHLLQFTYRFFANHLVQAFSSIMGTIVIAVCIGQGYYGWFFKLSVTLYCITIILIALANNHISEKMKDIKIFQHSLCGLRNTLRAWAITLQKGAKAFYNTGAAKKVQMTDAEKSRILKDADFQTAAFTVCETLCDLLVNSYGSNDVYVTVYQKFEADARSETPYCKMIAYSDKHEPTSFDTCYAIPEFSEDNYGKIEYHSYIFSSGRKDGCVLENHKAAMEAFQIHVGCNDREEKIQQYIGIPISPAKLGVTFLLQVDTCIPALFGKDHYAVKEFAENIIYPFAQFLHMMYEEGRLIEQLIH